MGTRTCAHDECDPLALVELGYRILRGRRRLGEAKECSECADSPDHADTNHAASPERDTMFHSATALARAITSRGAE